MCTFDPTTADQSIAPDLSSVERIEYVLAEIDKVIDMLDGAEDCKWIYQALINMSQIYHRLKGAHPPQSGLAKLDTWLQTLEKMDPLRAGRWNDMRSNILAHNPET